MLGVTRLEAARRSGIDLRLRPLSLHCRTSRPGLEKLEVYWWRRRELNHFAPNVFYNLLILQAYRITPLTQFTVFQHKTSTILRRLFAGGPVSILATQCPTLPAKFDLI